MSGFEDEMNSEGLKAILRGETERARNLLSQCRSHGILVRGFGALLRTARESISEGHLELAVEQLRRLNLELLDALVSGRNPSAPPAGVENPPAPTVPSEEVLAAINRVPAWKVRIPLTPPHPEDEATHE